MRNSLAAERGSTVQSVDRAVTILELLAQHGTAGVTALAAELGVHKSTASRLLGALEARGLVEQVEERGQYRLGVGILRLAGATNARLDLVEQARPICRTLAAATKDTVNLTVLDAGTRGTGSASTSRSTRRATARSSSVSSPSPPSPRRSASCVRTRRRPSPTGRSSTSSWLLPARTGTPSQPTSSTSG